MKDIDTILSQMTLEEKAGQLIMSSFVERFNLPDDMDALLQKGAVGSILYFSGSNVIEPIQLRNLTEKVQISARKNRFGIPVFVAIDQEGGQLAPITQGMCIGPGNMALGAIRDEKIAEKASYDTGYILGTELASIGITTCFAPVVDLCDEGLLPVKDNRYFGSNPQKAALLTSAFIKGLNKSGVMSCAKHFPGQRNVEIDSHYELDIIPYSVEDMMKRQWIPFKAAIDADVSMMMTLHAGFTAIDPTNTPSTLSKPIIDMLKGTLEYKGLVISDDIQMKPIKDAYGIEGALVKAIVAGVDIIIVSGGVYDAHEHIAHGVRSGILSEERLNEAVRKVLEYKQKFIPDIFPAIEDVKKTCAQKKNIEIIQHSADNSITVLKNEHKLLPLGKLEKNKRLSIIRPSFGRLVLSDNTNFYQFTFKEVFSKYFDMVIEYSVGLEPHETEILGACDLAFIADYTLICTYNAYMYEQQIKLLERCRYSTPEHNIIVAVLRSPTDSAIIPEWVKTVVASYGVAECSLHGLAKTLRGDISPTGIVPVGVGNGKISYGSGLNGW